MSVLDEGTAEVDGRVVLVTGACGAIGRAYVERLAERGVTVVANDLGRPAHGAMSVFDRCEEWRGQGLDVHPVAGDVIHEAAQILNGATALRGRLDGLIANAGISRASWHSGSHPSDIENLDLDLFDLVADVSFKGSARLAHYAWSALRETQGSMLLTSSGTIFGVANSSAYLAAKGALAALTKGLAMEGARSGVRVNCVAPIAWTDLLSKIPGDAVFQEKVSALFTPERIAEVGVWLILDGVETGEVVSVGGGFVGKIAIGTSYGDVLRDDVTLDEEFMARALSLSRGVVFSESSGEDLNFKLGRASGLSTSVPQLEWPTGQEFVQPASRLAHNPKEKRGT